MKKLFFFITIICHFGADSQTRTHEIGIGVGSISYHPWIKVFQIESPFYNSRGFKSFDFVTVSILQTPTLYYSTKIHGNLIGRINCSYRNHTFYNEYLDHQQNYYSYIANDKNIYLHAGVQYNFKGRNFTFYPAVEFAPELNYQKYIFVQYSGKRYNETQTDKSRYFAPNVNLLLGMNVKLRKGFSLSYEGGLFHYYLAPVSRLSLNYSFN